MSNETKRAIAKAAKAIEQCYQDDRLEIMVYYHGTEDGSLYRIPYTSRSEMAEKIEAATVSGWLVIENRDVETEEIYINMDNVDCIKL